MTANVRRLALSTRRNERAPCHLRSIRMIMTVHGQRITYRLDV